LQNIFVETFAGNMQIFIFLIGILLAALAARFRMPNIVFGMMIIAFGVMFSTYLGGLFVVILIFTSLLIYMVIYNAFK
jgi:hypothetical protein